MKLQFDKNENAIFLELDDSQIVESEEVYPGIILDFNKKNQVVAIEVLRGKNRIRRLTVQKDTEKS
jgi:uncharacterized protein YuzE